MFVFPRWLKVSVGANAAHFDARDWDAAINEIFQCVNGNLTDENFAEIPYEAIKWWSHVRDKTGEIPSWRGHIHDGVSARKFGGGVVNNDHMVYDGSLGLLQICEGDNEWSSLYNLNLDRGTWSYNKTWVDGPQPSVLYGGKFSANPVSGGMFEPDEGNSEEEAADRFYARVVVPFDETQFPGGHLFNPVLIGSVHAEMSRDTFPESGVENEDVDMTSDQRFAGIGVNLVTFGKWTGGRASHAGDPGGGIKRYFLLFSVIVPPARHPISLGVARWWVHWILMAKVGKREPVS